MEFVCRIGTPDGRVLEQVFQASDEAALRGDLDRRGMHVFTVRRRGLALGLPALRRRAKRVPMQTFLVFNQELAALLKAGLPLLQALDLMLERLREPEFRAVLTEIRDEVKSGSDLSQAFAAHGDMFPSLYASTLKAGERSGELESVIRRFIRYMRLVLDARKRVFAALVYPMVLVGLAIAMIVVMTLFVVPRFMGFFGEMGVELPLLTRITLGFSIFMRHNALWIALAAIGGWIALRRYADTATGRRAVDRWKLGLPFIGPVLHRFALAEFCRSLATLLSGGIPLPQALEISVESVGNAHIQSRLQPTLKAVNEGQAFNATLEQAGVFEPLEIDMVKVGEATGSLDVMLQSVSEFLDEQVEVRMGRLLTLIEPLMLIFMGIIVAILLVSIYLPMFGALGQSKF
ncbi:MAG: type II secretion system F family protein [Acidobacteriota bacterium]